jgi:hypothetical protein
MRCAKREVLSDAAIALKNAKRGCWEAYPCTVLLQDGRTRKLS